MSTEFQELARTSRMYGFIGPIIVGHAGRLTLLWVDLDGKIFHEGENGTVVYVSQTDLWKCLDSTIFQVFPVPKPFFEDAELLYAHDDFLRLAPLAATKVDPGPDRSLAQAELAFDIDGRFPWGLKSKLVLTTKEAAMAQLDAWSKNLVERAKNILLHPTEFDSGIDAMREAMSLLERARIGSLAQGLDRDHSPTCPLDKEGASRFTEEPTTLLSPKAVSQPWTFREALEGASCRPAAIEAGEPDPPEGGNVSCANVDSFTVETWNPEGPSSTNAIESVFRERPLGVVQPSALGNVPEGVALARCEEEGCDVCCPKHGGPPLATGEAGACFGQARIEWEFFRLVAWQGQGREPERFFQWGRTQFDEETKKLLVAGAERFWLLHLSESVPKDEGWYLRLIPKAP